jgi:hypothetical protein
VTEVLTLHVVRRKKKHVQWDAAKHQAPEHQKGQVVTIQLKKKDQSKAELTISLARFVLTP